MLSTAAPCLKIFFGPVPLFLCFQHTNISCLVNYMYIGTQQHCYDFPNIPFLHISLYKYSKPVSFVPEVDAMSRASLTNSHPHFHIYVYIDQAPNITYILSVCMSMTFVRRRCRETRVLNTFFLNTRPPSFLARGRPLRACSTSFS
jgi:hypothetical protein